MSYKYKPKEVRIKVTKQRLLIFSVIILLFFILVAFYPNIVSWYSSFQPLKEISYFNIQMKFREDLKAAKNIAVYPDEDSIKKVFWRENIKGIFLGILNSTNQTNFIGVEAYEITFKLSSFYTLNGLSIEIKGREIARIDELKGNYTHPVILIIPPVIANETAVRLQNYTVYVSGKSLKELDLSTIKFLMIVLNINV
ncbi:MAG: hypothetical protein QXD89_02245 [Candidatus Aenigmatarchaeota archaeon]